MSILIKGMEMPESCAVCKLSTIMHHGELICKLLNMYADDVSRDEECPLVPVPSHGRLIDADALLKTNNPVGKSMVFGGQYVYTENEIQAAPTIIETEGTNDGN